MEYLNLILSILLAVFLCLFAGVYIYMCAQDEKSSRKKM